MICLLQWALMARVDFEEANAVLVVVM